MNAREINSSTLTREIQLNLSEAARRRKIDRTDPQIKIIIAKVDELSRMRMNLTSAGASGMWATPGPAGNDASKGEIRAPIAVICDVALKS